MSIILKVNGLDLSTYVKLWDDDSLEPVHSERIEPQFAGSPGLREGLSWVSDVAGNNEGVFPMILKAATTDALMQLVRDINNALQQGASVEYKPEGASQSTFFDLESGRVEANYQHALISHGRLRCTLRLWTGAYGHTGVFRNVINTTGIGPQVFPVTGILGDVEALGHLEIRAGSAVATSGRMMAWGFHQSASFNPLTPGGSLTQSLGGLASLIGGSGAVGSQYVGMVVPTYATGFIAKDNTLVPGDAYAGRHRVLGIVRTLIYPPEAFTFYALDRFGNRMGPTLQASLCDPARWWLCDFGELYMPPHASGQSIPLQQSVEIWGSKASGASGLSSLPFHITELVYLPLDIAAGIMRTGITYLAIVDDFNRFTYTQKLDDKPYPPNRSDAKWTRQAGYLGVPSDGYSAALCPGLLAGANFVGAPGASAIYSFASGQIFTEIEVSCNVQSDRVYPSAMASGAQVRLWPKAQLDNNAVNVEPTVGVQAKFTLGPSQAMQLTLLSHDGTATVLHASVGLGASAASAIFLGRILNLKVRVTGQHCDVWLATAPDLAGPMISADHPNFALAGNPMILARSGAITPAGASRVAPLIDDFRVQDLRASAADVTARARFRFESYPENRVIRGNASQLTANYLANFRGNLPRAPAVGSPGASGPGQLVVLQGEVDNFVGNDLCDVTLDVLERFTFFR